MPSHAHGARSPAHRAAAQGEGGVDGTRPPWQRRGTVAIGVWCRVALGQMVLELCKDPCIIVNVQVVYLQDHKRLGDGHASLNALYTERANPVPTGLCLNESGVRLY